MKRSTHAGTGLADCFSGAVFVDELHGLVEGVDELAHAFTLETRSTGGNRQQGFDDRRNVVGADGDDQAHVGMTGELGHGGFDVRKGIAGGHPNGIEKQEINAVG